jgi:flagellar biosynthesis protein FliQ
MIAAGYNRTIGALKNALLGLVQKGTRGSGLLQLAYVLVIVGLMAGFISALFSPVDNQSYIVFPTSGAQTIPEALVESFVVFVGAAGVYLIYLSGRQTTRTRTVNLYLGLAVLLVTVSILTGIEIAILKGYG